MYLNQKCDKQCQMQCYKSSFVCFDKCSLLSYSCGDYSIWFAFVFEVPWDLKRHWSFQISYPQETHNHLSVLWQSRNDLDGLVEDCSISSALAKKIQSCSLALSNWCIDALVSRIDEWYKEIFQQNLFDCIICKLFTLWFKSQCVKYNDM